MSMTARSRGPVASHANASVIGDVVARAQQGDLQAFEVLYREHSPAMYALCRRMIADDREARELLQDVFVRAWQRLPTFQGHSAFGTWLHRLAVNVVLEHLRSSKRDALRFLDDGPDDLTARSTQPDVQMDIEYALAQLPTGARTVFVLHDIHGYSHEEIADMTGIAAGTSRAQLWRARRTLMRLLDA